jgi:hypothetical protein
VTQHYVDEEPDDLGRYALREHPSRSAVAWFLSYDLALRVATLLNDE